LRPATDQSIGSVPEWAYAWERRAWRAKLGSMEFGTVLLLVVLLV
jgi:hypothetical protein